MSDATRQPGREVHSTHEMVVGLHARFDLFGEQIKDLHKDHQELRNRVSSLDGRMSTIETVSTLNQAANAEARQNMKQVVAAVENRLDKLMLGVGLTLLSVLGAMGVLLYQTVWTAATGGH